MNWAHKWSRCRGCCQRRTPGSRPSPPAAACPPAGQGWFPAVFAWEAAGYILHCLSPCVSRAACQPCQGVMSCSSGFRGMLPEAHSIRMSTASCSNRHSVTEGRMMLHCVVSRPCQAYEPHFHQLIMTPQGLIPLWSSSVAVAVHVGEYMLHCARQLLPLQQTGRHQAAGLGSALCSK